MQSDSRVSLSFNIIMLYNSLPSDVSLQLPSLPCKILILKVDDNETTVIDKWDLYCNSGSQKIKPKRNLFELHSLFLVKAAAAKFMSLIYYSARFMGSEGNNPIFQLNKCRVSSLITLRVMWHLVQTLKTALHRIFDLLQH